MAFMSLLIFVCRADLFAGTEIFRSISVSEGMTDLVVNSIFKDDKGFIWLGTNSSVERFDGVRLKKYKIGTSDNVRVYDVKNSPPWSFMCL